MMWLRSVDGQRVWGLGKRRDRLVLLDVCFMWPPWHEVDMYPRRYRSPLRTRWEHAARDCLKADGM